MYAITATGYRSIANPADAGTGETVAASVPQSLLDSIATSDASRASNAATLRTRAGTALIELRAYRDLAAPTNAQTAAIVKTLVTVAIGSIKQSLGDLNSTE